MIEDRVYVPNEMVCELCYPNAKEVGEVANGLFLMENEGTYAIMGSPGHKNYEIFFFPDKPTPDPDPENLYEEGPILEASIAWVDKVLDWTDTVKLRPEDGHFICSAAKESGWKQGDVLMWLYNRAGQLLEKKCEVSTQ